MKSTKKSLVFFLTLFLYLSMSAELIEKVYAVVNDQIITYSEYKRREQSLIKQLESRYRGKELIQQMNTLKKELLDRIINRKLLLSKAKTLDYDVEKDMRMMLDAIKKQNNFETDAQLIAALKSEGIDYDSFVNYQKEDRLINVFVYQEIESKIKIGSSEIMEFYRANKKQFTSPKMISLNCIFLNPANYVSDVTLEDKKKQISEELKTIDFKKVAHTHSEYPGKPSKEFLGNFKIGELDKTIENAALTLKPGRFTDWIKTDNGYYIIQLKEIIPEKLKDYKEVRSEIEKKLKQDLRQIRIDEYVKKLREKSYIRILK